MWATLSQSFVSPATGPHQAYIIDTWAISFVYHTACDANPIWKSPTLISGVSGGVCLSQLDLPVCTIVQRTRSRLFPSRLRGLSQRRCAHMSPYPARGVYLSTFFASVVPVSLRGLSQRLLCAMSLRKEIEYTGACIVL